MQATDHYGSPRLKDRSKYRPFERRPRFDVTPDSSFSPKPRLYAAPSAHQAGAVYGQPFSTFNMGMGHNGMSQQPFCPVRPIPHPQATPSQAFFPHLYLSGYPEYDGRYGPALLPPVLQQPYPLRPNYDLPTFQNAFDTMAGPCVSPIPPNCSVRSTIRAGSTSQSPLSRTGPPHKPKRTGHTCWVGNIVGGDSTEILKQLKDHFSVGFAGEIESVRYIEKTACAFVNYRTQEACDAAIRAFNGTMFNRSRLLCRAKRDTSGEDQMLAAQSPIGERKDSRALSVEVDKLSDMLGDASCGTVVEEDLQHVDSDDTLRPHGQRKVLTDRYFILKSLTQEDLEDSRVSRTWITQPHVQSILHAAYQESDQVYLVFSVNKSGSYYGYAKMLSSPFEEEDESTEQAADGEAAKGVAISKVAATEAAPLGRIVDDPARATLFWEAEREDLDERLYNGHNPFTPRRFRIEWLHVRPVHFHQVRGIRNPWNGNKDVKVARDGTELETSIGKQIIHMFQEDHQELNDDFHGRAWVS